MLTEAHSSLELLMYSTSVTIYEYGSMFLDGGLSFQFQGGYCGGDRMVEYGEAAQLTG